MSPKASGNTNAKRGRSGTSPNATTVFFRILFGLSADMRLLQASVNIGMYADTPEFQAGNLGTLKCAATGIVSKL